MWRLVDLVLFLGFPPVWVRIQYFLICEGLKLLKFLIFQTPFNGWFLVEKEDEKKDDIIFLLISTILVKISHLTYQILKIWPHLSPMASHASLKGLIAF